MRTVFKPLLLTLAMFAVTAPAMAAGKICIDTRDIRNTTPKNGGAALLFQMRDGTQWLNTLRGKCPDLLFDGFAWVVRNPDSTVCENEQSFRVLQSAEICTLGKFQKVAPARKPG